MEEPSRTPVWLKGWRHMCVGSWESREDGGMQLGGEVSVSTCNCL